MKKYIQYYIILLLFSCAKDYSIENVQHAKGSLQSDLTNYCLPKTVVGNYIVNQLINDSNFIQVTVNVTRTGLYTIVTDTISGYYFRASGSFSATGITQVKIAAIGKPVAIGTDNFKMSFDTSVCYVQINVLPVPGTTPSVYTLHGSPTSCMNYSLYGIYAKNIPMNDSNKISIELNVTTTGTYAISTDTINGYYFSGSGYLSTTGTQSVNLKAYGTPQKASIDFFTVHALLSTCTFKDTVATPLLITGTDYFPLNKNNYWNYDFLNNLPDTFSRAITDTIRINGNQYFVLLETPSHGTAEQYFFRKTDTMYYEYGAVDKYTNALHFNPVINGEIGILKPGIATGDTWTSAVYSGPATISNQVIIFRYFFTCKDANAVVQLNGNTFANVYKINVQPQLRSALSYPFANTSDQVDIYYAKGVGVIYIRKIASGYSFQELSIRNWLVN